MSQAKEVPTVKVELVLNEKEQDVIIAAIEQRIRKLVMDARQNDLIINNEPLRRQYSVGAMEDLVKATGEMYLAMVLLKRIANKVKPHTYKGEAGDE